MPRLSTQRYLQIHHQLQQLWSTNSGHFSNLTTNNQSALHRYFQTSSNSSDDILLRIRHQLTKAEPSLPQRAGRALKLLEQVPLPQIQTVSLPTKGKRTRGQRNISVRSVLRPEPDVHGLARALIEMARTELASKSQDSA